MYGRPKFAFRAYLRPFIVISAGLVIGFLFLKMALPKRSSSVFHPPENSSIPSTGAKMDLPGVQATPARASGYQAAVIVSRTPGRNCTYTSDYWRDHPQTWMADNVVIGQYSFTKEEALSILNVNLSNQALLLQKQFLAAVLNILRGADPATVEKTLEEASSWIDAHPPQIDLPETEQSKGASLARMLENFNTGVMGPGLCPDQPATPTPTLTPTPLPTATATPIELLPSPTIQAPRSSQPHPGETPALGASPTPGSGSAPTPAATAPAATVPAATVPAATEPAPTSAPTQAAPTSPPPPTDTPVPPATQPPPGQIKPTKEPKPTKQPNPNDTPAPTSTPQPTAAAPTNVP